MVQVPIKISGGVDFWIEFSYTDDADNPLDISSGKMEIRSSPSTTGTILFSSETMPATITITQPSSNTLRFLLPGSASKNICSQEAYWDAYAVDVNNNPVQLAPPSLVSITANISML